MNHHPSCPVRLAARLYDVPQHMIESRVYPCHCVRRQRADRLAGVLGGLLIGLLVLALFLPYFGVIGR